MMKNNWKKYWIVIIIVLVVLLIPKKYLLWDGGSIEYKSFIYKITKIHRLSNDGGYYKGTEIEIFGIKVFDNTKIFNDNFIENSFNAEVLEKRNENTLLVKVIDNNEYFRIGEEVIVHISNKEIYAEGMKLKILFDGSIEESYPPQISSSDMIVMDY